ncbi:Protein T10B10.8, partial [Aphelenchoides avenae]
MARCLLNVVSFAILPLLAQCAATADGGGAAVERQYIREYAFVSVLSSDDFLLAARVLGFSIKSTNSTIPFIVFCTEDVSNDSIATLEAEGIETRRIEKFDTPYIRTHKARKFQYTKIRLWSLTEFKVLVHLDLDTLLLDDVSELFQCGDFCASLRHSDMFNSGVFVFRPNMTVHAQMESSAHTLESYDGGDQGFLNSFFWQVKYAPMFAPNITWHERILRLSSAYNYDVGMYYLRNRQLVKPKIIHYTLGPLKPWKWWSYPTFDLNWKWLEV